MEAGLFSRINLVTLRAFLMENRVTKTFLFYTAFCTAFLMRYIVISVPRVAFALFMGFVIFKTTVLLYHNHSIDSIMKQIYFECDHIRYLISDIRSRLFGWWKSNKFYVNFGNLKWNYLIRECVEVWTYKRNFERFSLYTAAVNIIAKFKAGIFGK